METPDRRLERLERLERLSTLALKLGAVLAGMFVLLPALSLAGVALLVAAWGSWHGGEGELAQGDLLLLLAVALGSVGLAVGVATLLWRSLRKGVPALALVGVGGLACIAVGLIGIGRATGVDSSITLLSWAEVATGVLLAAGAALGVGARVERRRSAA